MKKLRYILATLPCLAILLIGGACHSTPATGSDEDSTTLRLGVLPTVDCLPFYYADSLGLFDSLGVNIRLLTFDAAMDADTAFKNGDIDGIVSDVVKAGIWNANGDSLHMAMCGDLRLWLVTAQNARLLKAGSLKEKIIGITRNSALDFFTDQILAAAKLQSIDLNKPQINNIRLRTIMVDQNQYDGAILPEPYASEAIARGAKRLDGTASLNLEQMLCVLFSDFVARQRKDEVDKIRTAYDQAVRAMNADTLANLLDFLPEPHRIFIPDTLFTYTPLAPSCEPNDSLMATVRRWAEGRGLIKK